MDIKIIEAKKEHLDSMCNILDESTNLHMEIIPEIFGPPVDGDKKYLEGFIQNKDCYSFVAIDNDVVIGFIVAKRIDADEHGVSRKILYISDMGVSTSYIRRGIGRKLYEVLKSEVKDTGIEAVEIRVYDDNECAKRAYESLGFKTLFTRMIDEL